ncbi:MAG: heparinase II/III family protein, partial [Planctomycetota bacterium]|nr:heparinase II/III family protein [Planctomycetota bacterium]
LLGIDPADPDDDLLDALWTIVSMPTWSNSAHLPGQDLPSLDLPSLDLLSCNSAVLLAECRELLLPWLVTTGSDTLATTIITAIDRHILTPFSEGYTPWWAAPNGIHNNWTGVCSAQILGACLSLQHQGIDRPIAKQRALELCGAFFERCFTTDGTCDEGPGYWSYGVGTACLHLMRLSPSEREAVISPQRLAQVADYPRRIHLYGDQFYAAGDATSTLKPNLTAVSWLASATASPWLADWCRAHHSADPTKPTKRVLADWRACHIDEFLAAAPSGNTSWQAGADSDLPDLQIVIRHAGPACATFAGGHNQLSHNHNDVGHVNLSWNQQAILIDQGKPDYTADFFGPKRYDYRCASSLGHNVPVIAGQAQIPGRAAAASVCAGPDASGQTIDGTACYDSSTGLKRWTRQLHLAEHAATITDSFTLPPTTAVELRWWTLHQPTAIAGGLAIGPMQLQCSTGTLRCSQISSSDEQLVGFAPNTTLWCVHVDAVSADDGTLTLTSTLSAAET